METKLDNTTEPQHGAKLPVMCSSFQDILQMIDRVIWIVLDSVGMGEMPDAEKFGDVGANP